MEGRQTRILNSEQCPQFFKLYMPAHCSTQLRIPPAFLKYFEGCLPLKFVLVTCTRKSWEVDMSKVDDDVYFKSGWEKFVQDNSLEFGDFLIFYYNGGSNFYVSISGINNCLKEIEVANNTSEKLPSHIQGNETNETDEQSRFTDEKSTLSFEVIMRPSYMIRFVSTTKAFYMRVKEYRPMAKLQHLGRTWDVQVVQNGERFRFQRGWSSFVTETGLKVGDICCFKMIDIKSEFYLLEVSISRDL